MKINLYRQSSEEPEIFDVQGASTVGEALAAITNPEFQQSVLDSSGIRRFVSAYLGVPGQGVRNVRSELGMETAIKEGEVLTLLIADPYTT